ncbi:hypothetical protein K0038_03327 [Pseudomonas syringae]|nr:hypothetical protein [Pseudomonas syringae]
MHTHAEHGHDSVLPDANRSSHSSVGMPFVTLRVSSRRSTVEHGHDSVLSDANRSSRSSVGTPFVTLCVTHWFCDVR